MTDSNQHYSYQHHHHHHHHHHEHHLDEAEEFKRSSMRAMRMKKVVPKILFAILFVVTACVCAFVVWAYSN